MATKLDELFFEISVKKGPGADRAIASLIAAIQKTEKATKKATKATKAQDKAIRKTSKGGDKLKKTLLKVVAALGGFLIIKTVIKLLDEFETRMAEISTISGENIFRFEQLRSSILKMSLSLPKSPADLAAGAYQVISAGVTDASDALIVLEASATAATAGLAGTKVAVDAITTVLNAFGLAASDAARVSDVLFKTVEQGKVTFPELASTIGNVATSAGLAGVTIEELAAGIATLTKFGINAAEATTSLNRLFLTLVQQTDEQKLAFKQLGIEFSVAAVKEKGLAGVIAELNVLTDGQIELLAELFPNIRAARSAFVLAGDGAGEYARILAEAQTAQGAATVAAEKMTDTFEGQFQLFKNRLNVGVQELFRDLLPQLGQVLLDVANIFVSSVDREIAALEKLGLKTEATIARLKQQTQDLQDQQEGFREQAASQLELFFFTGGRRPSSLGISVGQGPGANIAQQQGARRVAENQEEINRLLTEQGALEELIEQKKAEAATASQRDRIALAEQVELLEDIILLLEAAETAENDLTDLTNIETRERREQIEFLDRQLAILRRIGDEDSSRIVDLQRQRDILSSQQEVTDIDIAIRDLKLPDETLEQARQIFARLQDEINTLSLEGDVEAAERKAEELDQIRALITLLERQLELEKTIAQLEQGPLPEKEPISFLTAEQLEIQNALFNELTKITNSAAEAQLIAIRQLEIAYEDAFKGIDEKAAAAFASLRESANAALDAEGVKATVDRFTGTLQARLDEIEFDFLGSALDDEDALRERINRRIAVLEAADEILVAQIDHTDTSVDKARKLLAERLKLLKILREEREALRDINKEEDKTLKLLNKELVERLALIALIKQTSDGVLDLADAFGIVDDEVRKVLEGVEQIGTGIATLGPALAAFQAGGSVFPVIAAGTSILGGVAQILKGGGTSPAVQAGKDVTERNTQALEDLGRRIGDLDAAISGSAFASAQKLSATLNTSLGFPSPGSAAARARQQLGIGGPSGTGTVDVRQQTDLQRRIVAELGLTMDEFESLIRSLGGAFEFGAQGLDQFAEALDLLTALEITQFADSVSGAMRALNAEFEIFDITNPIKQMERLREVFDTFDSPALRTAIAGLDLSTPEGRRQAQENIENLFRQIQAGTLDPALLGGLTGEELVQFLLDFDKLLDAAAISAGDTQDVRASISITELQANQLLAFQSTLVFRAEERNQLLVEMLSALTGQPITLPPNIAAATQQGATSITVTVGPNTFAIGNESLELEASEFVDQIAEQLGERLQDRLALFGDAT